MKQVYFFFFLLLLTASCKKETPVDTDVPALNNPTSYLLEKISYYHSPGELGLEYLFEYNAANLIKEAKEVQWTQNRESNTIRHQFEYRGNLPIKCITQRDGYTWYTDYFYKGNLMTHKVAGYSITPSDAYTRYVYDEVGNLVEAVDSTDRTLVRHVFTYNNNLTTKTDYTLWSTPQKKSKVEFSGYDTKVNFTKTINGLPSMFTWETLGIAFYATTNNYTTSTNYSAVPIDNEYSTPYNINFTYQYNEEGLPTKMFAGSSVTVFEYKKYK